MERTFQFDLIVLYIGLIVLAIGIACLNAETVLGIVLVIIGFVVCVVSAMIVGSTLQVSTNGDDEEKKEKQ